MNLEEIKRMTPAQKARVMGEATKFCLQHNLLRPQEVELLKSQDRAAALRIGVKSVIRQEAYLRQHPQQEQ